MSVNVIDTIKPKNGGSFPVVEAVDVSVSGGTRLDAALAAKANVSDLAAKANQSDVANLQTAIALKAPQSSLDALSVVVATKAPQSSLDALSVVVAGKADKSDYTDIYKAIDTKADSTEVAEQLSTKADKTTVNTSVNDLQNQIDQIEISASAEAVVAPEVAAARVGADSTSYSTLKERLDAEYNNQSDEFQSDRNDLSKGQYSVVQIDTWENKNITSVFPFETTETNKYLTSPALTFDNKVICDINVPDAMILYLFKLDTENETYTRTQIANYSVTYQFDPDYTYYFTVSYSDNSIPLSINELVNSGFYALLYTSDSLKLRAEYINVLTNSQSEHLPNYNFKYGLIQAATPNVIDFSNTFLVSDFITFNKTIAYKLKGNSKYKYSVLKYTKDTHQFIQTWVSYTANENVVTFEPDYAYIIQVGYSDITVKTTISLGAYNCIECTEDMIKVNDIGWTSGVLNTHQEVVANSSWITSNLIEVDRLTPVSMRAYTGWKVGVFDVTTPDQTIVIINYTTFKTGLSFNLEVGKKYRICMCNAEGTTIDTSAHINCNFKTGIAGTTQRFTVDVNCKLRSSWNTETDTANDENDIYSDNGFIMLPDSYSETGTKTRLIISCHGAGGTVTTNDSQVENQPLTKYLVANGYAVMDVAGLPAAFATAEGIDPLNNIGSFIALECYIKAYHYCMEHFNLYDEVLLMGASMGGITSTNICMSGSIPVIAQAGYCPVLDTYNEIFLHPWSSGAPKKALGIIYELDTDGENQYIYDEDKVRGYNPVNNLTVSISDTKYTFYPVPVKFWHCENDPTVAYNVTAGFVEAVRNAGRTAYLRSFTTGGHEPQNVGTAIVSPSGNTNCRGEIISVKPAVEETLLWFNRFK